MSLEEGQSLKGVPIDVVFIGSCTNGRLSDLEEVARLVKGRKVNPKVKALVVPGSQEVQRQAAAKGLPKVFTDAGFQWLVEDIEVAQAGEDGVSGGAAELRGHLQAEVPGLVRAKATRAGGGCGGKAGAVLGIGDLTSDLKLGADQFQAPLVEPELVRRVPQPRPTAEGVQQEPPAFLHVRVRRDAQTKVPKIETRGDVQRIARHRRGAVVNGEFHRECHLI